MRTCILAIVSAALLALPNSAFSQAVEFGLDGFRIRPHHRHYEYGADQGECKELRLACVHKEELGEQGHGNCRRYRESLPRALLGEWEQPALRPQMLANLHLEAPRSPKRVGQLRAMHIVAGQVVPLA